MAAWNGRKTENKQHKLHSLLLKLKLRAAVYPLFSYPVLCIVCTCACAVLLLLLWPAVQSLTHD